MTCPHVTMTQAVWVLWRICCSTVPQGANSRYAGQSSFIATLVPFVIKNSRTLIEPILSLTCSTK